jgi:alanine racemase
MAEALFTKSVIEVSRKALRENFEALKKMVAPTDVMAVIKANGYGHGLMLCAWELSEAGASWFAVDSVKEGEEVRRTIADRHNARILVLGYVPHSQMFSVFDWDLSFVLFERGQLDAVEAAFRKHPFILRKAIARIHIPLETGLHREGFSREELPGVLKHIKELREKFPDRVVVEGVQMHFANVEDTTDSSYAEHQLKRFEEMEALIKGEGIVGYKKHTASSAASFLYSKARFDLARPGIALYGLYSGLTPALTWKTMVAQVKNVSSGEPVGYGLTERVSRDSTIAVIPIGYYDGYDRALSGTGEVLIRGKRCKVLGRICMDMFMVDVTELEAVQAEDEVVLIGAQGQERITADEMAEKIGTINYEVVARLNPQLPRTLVD